MVSSNDKAVSTKSLWVGSSRWPSNFLHNVTPCSHSGCCFKKVSIKVRDRSKYFYFHVYNIFQTMLQLMNMETVIPRLTSILFEASMPRDQNLYKTGFWGRAQVSYNITLCYINLLKSIDHLYFVFYVHTKIESIQ